MLIERFFATILDIFISLCAFFAGILICGVFGAMTYGIIYPDVEQVPEPWSSRIVYLSFIAGIVYAVFVWRKRRKNHTGQPTTVISGGIGPNVSKQPLNEWPRTQSINRAVSSPANLQSKAFTLHKEPPIEPIIPVRQEETSYSPVNSLDTVEAQLYAIDWMEGHEFELWCADALRKLGYHHVKVTPGSGDQGVDVLAQKDGIKYAVQCKRYSSDLGNKPVQEVHAGKAIYHCHVGVVITNQHFTTGAKELAAATDTLLWDREWIHKYLLSQSHPISTYSHPVSSNSILADDLFYSAVDVVMETGQASVSMVQRRLGLGYAQAARLIDLMEEKGVIGPFQGSKPRAILITKQQWQSVRNTYQ